MTGKKKALSAGIPSAYCLLQGSKGIGKVFRRENIGSSGIQKAKSLRKCAAAKAKLSSLVEILHKWYINECAAAVGGIWAHYVVYILHRGYR